jgi:hypothetical protein
MTKPKTRVFHLTHKQRSILLIALRLSTDVNAIEPELRSLIALFTRLPGRAGDPKTKRQKP